MRVGTGLARAVMDPARRLLALPLGDLCLLLPLGKLVERFGGEPEGSGYSEVALVLWE